MVADYKIDYMVSRNKQIGDWIGCEICGKSAVDIHHITPSMRSKRKHNKDGSDLIGLCRFHHSLIHSENTLEMRTMLYNIVQSILSLTNGGELSTELEKLSSME